MVALLLTRGGAELEETAKPPIVPEAVVAEAVVPEAVVPEAVAPAVIPQVTAPNRPAATAKIVPDLSGLPIVQPARPVSYQRPARTDVIVADLQGLQPQVENRTPGVRPARTDVIVVDTSGLPIIVPAAPGTPGEFLPI